MSIYKSPQIILHHVAMLFNLSEIKIFTLLYLLDNLKFSTRISAKVFSSQQRLMNTLNHFYFFSTCLVVTHVFGQFVRFHMKMALCQLGEF
jgi:hypothetical protein